VAGIDGFATDLPALLLFLELCGRDTYLVIMGYGKVYLAAKIGNVVISLHNHLHPMSTPSARNLGSQSAQLSADLLGFFRTCERINDAKQRVYLAYLLLPFVTHRRPRQHSMFNGRTYMLQALQKKIRASTSTPIHTSFIFDDSLIAMQDASTLN
jgi:hypothetical protein